MKQSSEMKSSKSEAFEDFLKTFEPLEAPQVKLLTDYRTNAHYCECHIRAKRLIELSTTDVDAF
jgi:hypothetical protein